ncbi:MAG: hypothetical protein ACRDHM_11725 [Actinomycetota bacterium]
MKLARLIPSLLVPVLLFGATALAAPGDCRLIRGAATPDPADDVEVCRQDVWFHQAETKLGNVGATGETSFPSWNTTKPATSVSGGAGGGYLGHWAGDFAVEEYLAETTATFEGTFTGNLDNAAVTLYLFAPAYNASGATEYAMRTQLVVDGVQLYTSDFVNGDAVNISSGGTGVLKVDFVFVGLFGLLGPAPGDHQIRLSVTPYFPGDEAMYVYDTSEVPSGIAFNLEPSGLTSYTQLQPAG